MPPQSRVLNKEVSYSVGSHPKAERYLTWAAQALALSLLLALLLAFGDLVGFTQPLTARLRTALGIDATMGLVITIGNAVVLLAMLLLRKILARHRRAASEPAERMIRFPDLNIEPDAPLSHLQDVASRVTDLGHREDVDSVRLVNEIISGAFSVGASDIHISPEREDTQVIFRVDGVLHEVGTISFNNIRFVRNRFKILARLPIHVHATPQDGAIICDRDDCHLRVSTLPTSHGEKLVIRLAFGDEKRYRLDRIGFPPDVLTVFKAFLARDHGVVYLTGPTGSGKTTTLYASMLHIRQTRKDTANLVTLEDPIEIDFPQITQTQVDPATGLTFAVGLRSILRQDPDVIMVGEIRDEETAQVAIRAGMTGHLLLTSVHAESSPGVFARLKQLNVEWSQLASASVAVVNQRLAIRNCPDCTTEVETTPAQRQHLELLKLPSDGPFFAGQGCSTCGGKGRLGRIPLLEVLPVSDHIRDQLLEDTPTYKLAEIAIEQGMVTLTARALEQVRQGVLPIDEAIRVLTVT